MFGESQVSTQSVMETLTKNPRMSSKISPLAGAGGMSVLRETVFLALRHPTARTPHPGERGEICHFHLTKRLSGLPMIC